MHRRVPCCSRKSTIFGLYERLQGLNREGKGSHEVLSRRLESKLEKSDAVVNLFFDLIKNQHKPTDSAIELRAQVDPISPVMETYQQLRHVITTTTRS
jgi:hypothetical protein